MKVIDLWGECDRALEDIAVWADGKAPYYLGKHKVLKVN